MKAVWWRGALRVSLAEDAEVLSPQQPMWTFHIVLMLMLKTRIVNGNKSVHLRKPWSSLTSLRTLESPSQGSENLQAVL